MATTLISGVQYSGIWNLNSQAGAKAAGTWPNLDEFGSLYSWGYNAHGDLGLNNTTYYSSPKQVGSLTTWLTIAGGYQNTASGRYSNASGVGSASYLQGMQTFSTAGGFVGNGEAQLSNLVPLRTAALASNATTVLSLDGTGVTNLIIPFGTNRVWAVKVIATAVVSVALPFMTLGDSYMAEYTLLFKKIGGVSSVVGVIASNVIFDTNMETASFSFAAGASQDLQITFKAPNISGGSTYRCVARVELTEVAY